MFKPDKKKRGDPWVEDIKISPNNELAVLGAHQGFNSLEVLKVNA